MLNAGLWSRVEGFDRAVRDARRALWLRGFPEPSSRAMGAHGEACPRRRYAAPRRGRGADRQASRARDALGAVAGMWRFEDGAIRLEEFAPLGRDARRQVEEEAERLAALFAG